jgi:hypothetical protein
MVSTALRAIDTGDLLDLSGVQIEPSDPGSKIMTESFVKSSKFSTVLMPIIYGRIGESAGESERDLAREEIGRQRSDLFPTNSGGSGT